MSRTFELIFGFEDSTPKDVEELVDENETPQEIEGKEQVEEESQEEQRRQQWHKRTKRTSAYVAVFEEIMNEIIDHELELLSDEERRILRAFSQLPYLSKYTLSRLLQRNPGQWHPISTIEKFKKETGEHGLLASVKDLCTLSVSRLLSSSVKKEPSCSEPPAHEVIDLTLDSDDDNDSEPIPAGRSDASTLKLHFDSNSWFFCDDESKLELKEALHRLTTPDLHALAKDFKCTKSGKSNKDDVIIALLEHARGQTVISLAQSTPDRKGKGTAKDCNDLKQTTLKGFLKPKAHCRNQEQILLKRAVDKLGKCVRVNPQFYRLAIRLHIIYYRSTEMPPKPFTPSLLATFKKRFYPQYTHNRSVIWPTRGGLVEYERALQLQQLMSEAEITDPDSDMDSHHHNPGKGKWKKKEKESEKDGESKGETKAAIRSRAILEIFEKSQVEELWDACSAAEGMKWYIARRPELERFQSGHILTRLMYKAAAACGPLREYDEELRLLNKLLKQKFWRRGKRAEWYRRRAVVMTKKNDKPVLQQALEGIEEALHDPDTHLVLRPDLFERYKKLEARLRIPERLRSKVEHELRKPVSVRFTGHRVYSTQATQPLKLKVPASGSEDAGGGGSSVNAELTSYFTKVPVPIDTEKEEAARLVSEAAMRSTPKWAGKSRWRGEGGGEVTVEELALQYYAKRGYNGFHSETRILTTVFSLLFWDVLFANIPGAFETRFQAGPLDLAEDSFYYARKDAIEQRLKEIQEGYARKIVERHDTLYRGRNTLCVGVRWDVCSPEDLLEAVECLKTETLISICRLFCEDYAARARGVPDLFVWDYGKRECKFVEVKGPGDRPSETQKLWFDTLLAAGADVEICSVVALTFKSVNSKKRKMKGTEKVERPPEHAEFKEEDEYQPEFDGDDSEEGGGHLTPSSSRRLRSATLVRDNIEVGEKGAHGVESTSQPRALSVKWHLEVEVNAVVSPAPSPRKKHKYM